MSDSTNTHGILHAKISRHSDMSVLVSFPSTRAASAFQNQMMAARGSLPPLPQCLAGTDSGLISTSAARRLLVEYAEATLAGVFVSELQRMADVLGPSMTRLREALEKRGVPRTSAEVQLEVAATLLNEDKSRVKMLGPIPHARDCARVQPHPQGDEDGESQTRT
jgi:hypothetical protein